MEPRSFFISHNVLTIKQKKILLLVSRVKIIVSIGDACCMYINFSFSGFDSPPFTFLFCTTYTCHIFRLDEKRERDLNPNYTSRTITTLPLGGDNIELLLFLPIKYSSYGIITHFFLRN